MRFSIRGKLSCFTPLFRNIGILLAFVIGAAADYTVVPCIFILFPLLFVCTFSFLPNSPQFYLLRGENEVRSISMNFSCSKKFVILRYFMPTNFGKNSLTLIFHTFFLDVIAS